MRFAWASGSIRSTAMLLAVCCALMACASAPHAGDANRNDGELSIAADRLILVTVDNSTPPMIGEPGSTPHGYSATNSYALGDQARSMSAALAHDYGLQKVREWPIAPLKVQCLVFAIPVAADREALMRRLSADARVQLVQPLQLFNALGSNDLGNQTAATPYPHPNAVVSRYNDPYIGLQHGFAQIDAAAAQLWTRGEGVNVAIIDTGVATSHPDLDGRITLTRNFIDDDMKAFQTDRHGTQIAGIIGADANNGLGIVGVAPAARLQIYKACEPTRPQAMEAECNTFTLARALGAAIDGHAQIVNLSLGGPSDPLLSQIVGYGVQHGIIFVGAVPQSGRLDGFPLGVVGVIAVDQSGQSENTPGVLHAPGRDIVSTAPDGRYDFATGSSFAAAHVTGAIALLRTRAPAMSAVALQAVLERTRTPQRDGSDTINICAALDAIQPRDDCMHSARAIATATAN
jgi:hypothetical protein